MTITETSPDEVAAAVGVPSAAAAAPVKVAGWLTSADHTRVGRLYVGVSLLAAIGVLVVGVLLMAERIDTGSTFLPSDAVAQLTSFLWMGLVFLVVVPLLLGVAIAVVPLQVGGLIAYPRAAALSFWGWLFSGAVMVGSYLANGGPGGGEAKAVDVFLVSLILVVVALTIGAASVAGTVITRRAPGLGLLETPPFAFACPGQRRCAPADPSGGGRHPGPPLRRPSLWPDRLRGQRGHRRRDQLDRAAATDLRVRHPDPRSHGRAVPRRRRPAAADAGRRAGRLGLSGVAAVGGAMQGMPTLDFSGATPIQGLGRLVLYGITALLPVLPFLMVLGLGGMALKGGRPRPSGPFGFAIAAALMGLVGALIGVLTPIVDLDLIGTVYQEAQAYYLLFAGLLAGMGAVAYWGPKLWGRRLPDKAVGGLAALGPDRHRARGVPVRDRWVPQPASRRGEAGTTSTARSSSATSP